MRGHDSTCICNACRDGYDRNTRYVSGPWGESGADEIDVNYSGPNPDGSTCPCRECRWWREQRRKEAEEARQMRQVDGKLLAAISIVVILICLAGTSLAAVFNIPWLGEHIIKIGAVALAVVVVEAICSILNGEL
jgi:hypothetical protein